MFIELKWDGYISIMILSLLVNPQCWILSNYVSFTIFIFLAASRPPSPPHPNARIVDMLMQEMQIE